MSLYKDIIMKCTGCTHDEASEIEEIMRHDIFHSTLDWIPEKVLIEAAKVAHGYILERDKIMESSRFDKSNS